MNGRDPSGLGDPTTTREIDLIEQRAQLEKQLQQAEDDSGWGSILSDTLQHSWQTLTSPVRAVLRKRAEVEHTFVQTGGGGGRLAAPKAHLETDAANREAASDIGASDALTRERATRVQNQGLRKIAEKGGELAGAAAYQAVEGTALAGGAIVLGGVRDEIIAQNDLRHPNAGIAEWRGYQGALESGQIGIAAPGKVTAKGVDFITFDPANEGSVVIWDAKYRASGKFPRTIPPQKVKRWTDEARAAIRSLPEGQLKTQAERAIEAGRIRPDIFKWPQ